MSILRTLTAIVGWPVRHWRYTLAGLLVLAVARHVGATLATVAAVAALVVPAVAAGVWGSCWPGSFERCIAGPHRRWRWRRWARRAWPSLARECGLAVLRDGQARRRRGCGCIRGCTGPAPAGTP